MEPIKYTLTFERSTKNYHVYRAAPGTLVPDRVYLPLVTLGPNPPASVVVTVTTDEVHQD